MLFLLTYALAAYASYTNTPTAMPRPSVTRTLCSTITMAPSQIPVNTSLLALGCLQLSNTATTSYCMW